eukprot:Protomagalhaensia_wolfi_Nauph_80__2798@NODE_290_length_2899_cov_383_363986_g217_i0_p1_GENE_NODE_290_length_2899_cov_383_363986_g217_i0NODE_290_length_2899_cov_383_363986_g217_i0_p1_ORF_typecomplete_len340_score70_82EMC1_C/PF07774_13/7e23LRR_9/PF14580_6/0_016_NODE_290_length_2899_cov_383_363986_g217_i08271846
MATFKVESNQLKLLQDEDLVWSRYLGTIERIAVPSVPCEGKESLIHRKDGSILRSVCLDGFAAIITINEANQRTLTLLSLAEGSILHTQSLPQSSEVAHLLIDNNKITYVYENMALHRSELGLIELFTEHRSINRLVALANRLGLAQPPQTEETEVIQDGEIKIYHESFALDLKASQITSMAFTQTTQRVTPQTVVMAVPELEKIYLVPHVMFTARRPIPAELDQYVVEGVLPGTPQDSDVPPYNPLLPLIPWKFLPETLSNEKDLKLTCEAGNLESQTLVAFPGTTVEPIPYYPALKYDSLSDDYSQTATVGTLGLLAGCVIYAFRRLLTSKSSGHWK